MRRSDITKTRVAWAIACDLRRYVSGLVVTKWPVDGMTRHERRLVARVNMHLSAAESEICRLQASLSERSKLAGHDRPDFETARKGNDA